jgi:hypothetical protein
VEPRARGCAAPPLTSKNVVHRVWTENPSPGDSGRRPMSETRHDDAYEQGPVAALRRVAFLMER